MRKLIKWSLGAAGLAAAVLLAQAQTAPFSGGLYATFGHRYQATQDTATPQTGTRPLPTNTTERVLYWNDVVLKAISLDHVPAAARENRTYGEQYGPANSSRALAIVQLAVFDAINAIAQRYPSYSGLPQAASDTSPDAAVAQAAHDTLAALYPSQKSRFDSQLADDLARLPAGRANNNGTDLGRRAAAAVLALRTHDHSRHTDYIVGQDYFVSNAPGQWRPDPVSMSPLAYGARWGQVRPFVLPSVDHFRTPPPPALNSSAYTAAFNETKKIGGNGITTPTVRTREQTIIGIFWGYDSTPWVGTPPRLFNQLLHRIAQARTKDPVEMARLLALANVAIADATIAGWKDKYAWDFWRPVTGIREASEGTGPTGRGDANPDTRGDPHWTPLGAQASNLDGPNFTPPFPAYPSGHAVEGSAFFEVMRRFYGTDKLSFSFVSDEFNGITRDNNGHVRPRISRSFANLSQAEEECGRSRIYLGVHWDFDRTAGALQGKRVGDYVYEHGLTRP
jgi:hypothetical protein